MQVSVRVRPQANDYGVRFDRAVTIFLDPGALSLFDDQHSNDEERWLTLGLDVSGTLLVVSHPYMKHEGSSSCIRIFSARRATKRETVQYVRQGRET